MASWVLLNQVSPHHPLSPVIKFSIRHERKEKQEGPEMNESSEENKRTLGRPKVNPLIIGNN